MPEKIGFYEEATTLTKEQFDKCLKTVSETKLPKTCTIVLSPVFYDKYKKYVEESVGVVKSCLKK